MSPQKVPYKLYLYVKKVIKGKYRHAFIRLFFDISLKATKDCNVCICTESTEWKTITIEINLRYGSNKPEPIKILDILLDLDYWFYYIFYICQISYGHHCKSA